MITVNCLRTLIAAACLVLVAGSQTLLACSVCSGDPDAPMTKAAQAGILFLAVVIYGVLFSFAGVTVFWVVRARRLASTSQSPPEDDAKADAHADRPPPSE